MLDGDNFISLVVIPLVDIPKAALAQKFTLINRKSFRNRPQSFHFDKSKELIKI